MNTSRRHLASFAAIALLAAAPLAACSDDESTSDATTSTTPTTQPGGNQLPAPVIVDITTVQGTTVSVPLGNVVVVNADDPASWTGSVDDESIATFTPGSDDGTASFNPGFSTRHGGITTARLTNGTTTVVFTLEVTV
ncbi:MAG: hypothetical protein U0Q03_11040 [Acidimicrobiales bacterium]